MPRYRPLAAGALAVLLACALPLASRAAGAHRVAEQSKDAGPYRIVMMLLPAEPMLTAARLRRDSHAAGMLIVRGGVPVLPGDHTRPNHHLVVHVFDRASGRVVTGAHVKMTFVSETSHRVVERMQVVEMQAIGKGPASTHYGNNVTLRPGTYDVTVTVDARATATFVITQT